MPNETAERWLTPGVGRVGPTSFFGDAGHEMATSVLPTFLTSTLHAGPAALGAIEGVSDALIGLSKLAGGPLSNDPTLGTAIATSAIGVVTNVPLRALAWVSRAPPSPDRDTLLVSLVLRSAYGRGRAGRRQRRRYRRAFARRPARRIDRLTAHHPACIHPRHPGRGRHHHRLRLRRDLDGRLRHHLRSTRTPDVKGETL